MSDPVKPWCHLHVQTWPLIVEQLQRAGGEWAPEIVDQDLVWHEDQIRRGYLARLPSRRELATRWGWGDRKTRNRLQQLGEGWGVPTGSQQGPNRVPTGSQRKAEERQQSATKVPTGSQQGPTEVPTGSTRALVPETRDQRPETREEEPPLPPAGGDAGLADGIPAWVTPWSRELRTPRNELFAGLTEAVQGIRGHLREPSKTDAKEVVGLYRALDPRPSWGVFVADLNLVIAAAKDCPDGLFRNDIRGLREDGTPKEDMTDRSASVATICRRARWEDRVQGARAWDRAGRPRAAATGPPGRASPGGSRTTSPSDAERARALLDPDAPPERILIHPETRHV